jgi:DNA-binding NtrC family response regulator
VLFRSGLEVLRRVKAHRPESEVIVITGYGTIDTAIEAVREGAFHYLCKPFRLEEFHNLTQRVVEHIDLRSETLKLRASLLGQAGLEGLIGAGPEMREVFHLIRKVAPLDCTVLIQGASGIGKELVARAIHRLSPPRDKPFVSFNCGGFSPELAANELFGHEKGSYTGAFKAQRGLLETADQGTAFLEEIAEMSPEMQVNLLRVIQERQIYRLGRATPLSLDLCLVTATNRTLAEEVQQGRFREDLFFRINVVTINLPPLKDRPDDLPLLRDHFLRRSCQAYHKELGGFTPGAWEVLKRHDFPGHVRELENIVARAVALSDGPWIEVEDLPEGLVRPSAEAGRAQTLEEVERDHVRRVMAQCRQRRGEAARVLGVTRATL